MPVHKTKPRTRALPALPVRPDAALQREGWASVWPHTERIERERWITKRSLIGAKIGDALRLAYVESVLVELWAAIDRGEVDERARHQIDALYRAATGHTENAQLLLVALIADAARWSTVSDAMIAAFILDDYEPRHPEHAARLRQHPKCAELLAAAVRAWPRGRGRSRAGAPRKWRAVAEVLAAAGLGNRDELAVAKLWNRAQRKK